MVKYNLLTYLRNCEVYHVKFPNDQISVFECSKPFRQAGMNVKVNEIKEKMTDFCKTMNIPLIDNKNIDKSGLGMKMLHPNMKGKSLLANNFINFLKDL